MKKFLILLTTLVCLFGCTKFDIPEYKQAPLETVPQEFVPYETIYVNVPEGCKSIVYVGNKVVATCYKSGDVIIPKSLKPLTKAEDVLNYSIVTTETTETGIDSENTVEMVVAFEDTPEGDHDYNDLIFQARLHIVNNSNGTNTITGELTPIAFGATKKIGLGIIVTSPDNRKYFDKVLYNDTQEELFDNDPYFINTPSKEDHKHYDIRNINLETAIGSPIAGISWYIIVGDLKLFAANTFQKCTDNDDMPQGLVLMDLRDDIYSYEKDGETFNCGNDFWQYPMECVNIETVYPGFNEAFVKKGDFSILATPKPGSYYHNAIKDVELTVNSRDCIYTLYPTTRTSGDEPTTDAQAIDFGLSVKWADRNVGASSIEANGLFFEWGNTVGYLCDGETCDHTFTATYSTVLRESILGTVDPESAASKSVPGALLTDNFTSGDANYDAARANMGGTWRIPTTAEIQELYNNTLQRQETVNGVNGIKFVLVNRNGYKWDESKWTIYEDKWVFFPCAGIVDFTVSKSRGGFGYYWTCDIPRYGDVISPYNGTVLGVNFENGNGFQGAYSRSSALTIRAVCD